MKTETIIIMDDVHGETEYVMFIKTKSKSRAVPRKVLTITIRHCNPFNYKVDYERT